MRTVTCPVSQKKTASRPTYQPRRPRRSPLYRLLEDHFEEFLLSYEERFQSQYGPLRSDITRRTVYKYLDCGILDHGFARVVCPQCKAEFLIGFSCKTRFCPSCHAKKLTLWSERLVEELLEPVPHRMFTLTVPKRIRPFFLWNRKLLGTLARCAAETIRLFYRTMLQEPDGDPGIVISIQTIVAQFMNTMAFVSRCIPTRCVARRLHTTAGSALLAPCGPGASTASVLHRIHELDHFGNQAANTNPHIHCLAADGLFLPDGAFRSPSLLSPVDIAELFRRTVLKAFVKQELIPQEVALNMLSWPHSGFHVHIGPRLFPDDPNALGATPRYAARAPISLQRLLYDRENQQVSYSYTSAYDHREHIAELSPLELIARLTTHIPGRYERLIRYYGVYSSRSLGARRAKALEEEREVAQEKTPPTHLRRQWQRLLQRVFGVSLRCPTCGTEMKIIAVITQDEPIHKILTHLKSKKIDPRAGPFEEQAA